MILATIENGSADGALVVLSRDRQRYVPAEGIAANLLSAMEDWNSARRQSPGLVRTAGPG